MSFVGPWQGPGSVPVLISVRQVSPALSFRKEDRKSMLSGRQPQPWEVRGRLRPPLLISVVTPFSISARWCPP